MLKWGVEIRYIEGSNGKGIVCVFELNKSMLACIRVFASVDLMIINH